MINLKLLREKKEELTTAIRRKKPDFDADALLAADESRREFLQKAESLRGQQKAANESIAAAEGEAKAAAIAEMKKVADELKSVEKDLREAEEKVNLLLADTPNPPHESVPDGGEDDAVEVKKVGEPREFDFEIRDHAELGKILGMIDVERGVRTSGSRFYYLLGDAVRLQFALQNYILEILTKYNFTPVITPTLVREHAMFATGFFPADREQIYAVNPTTETNPDGDDLFLTGTSEVPLTMLHADEILDGEFPKRYCGWSTCYRREAGTYGKDTTGIFRVHQFDKFEMYSFCDAEKSWEEHDFLLSVEEEIIGGLGLPYHVVNIAAGDLGAPAAKKFDIEVWIPSQEKYRELTSCSNCTDYQARRAKIRTKKDGETSLIHTLNGTACAMTRMMIALLENFQNADGSVDLPQPLQKFFGAEKILPKK